ncbi:MAG: ABC transporter ATP-binding protein [Deltaproteobacteria bacterium]|nr:ABC transporter ATP-binding protein [Deltaproteobacteria bacterium]
MPADRQPLIDVRRASKTYVAGRQRVPAVADITLRVARGEFVSVMGPSGCGKSTLLNLLAGLDTPDQGSVVVTGQDLSALSDDERSDLRLQHVGFVFQSFNLFPTFTVEENVAWPLEFSGVGWPAARAEAHAALQLVGVEPTAHRRRPAELSGGEQQRVAIARALATKPRLLLADEPTGNLDSRTGQAILDLLRRLNAEQDLTVVMVTHSAFAATYGHRTIELRDGAIVREVRPSEAAPPACVAAD